MGQIVQRRSCRIELAQEFRHRLEQRRPCREARIVHEARAFTCSVVEGEVWQPRADRISGGSQQEGQRDFEIAWTPATVGWFIG